MSEQEKNPQPQASNTIVMQPTVSSNLKAYGYDFARQTMRVKFKNGAIYDVTKFSKDDFDKFQEADSRGRYFQLVIRVQPERWPVLKVEDFQGWDGEEKRVCIEPLSLVPVNSEKMIFGQGTQIELGNGVRVQLEGYDWSRGQEEAFVARVVACTNALVGIPTESLQFVVAAGLQAMGRMERRRVVWGTALYDFAAVQDNLNVPDEPTLEDELATADAAAHEGEE